ncbi:MAG: DUF3618 domain-containing protein [Actinobacteria bacterium]|nr:DUF3618 domain-containing protein [Actinomycetota bacterium]
MAQQNSPQTSPATARSSEVAPKVDVASVAAPSTPAAATPATKQAAEVKKSDLPAETTKESTPPRSMAQIEADMAATRERLANTIGQLQAELTPKNLARKQLDKVRSFYIDEYGAVRPDRVAMTAGVVVGGYVVIRVTKRVFS